MINLLKLTWQDHYKKINTALRDSLERLKSTCSQATFQNVNDFLKDTEAELCCTLQSRRNRKRTPNGRYSPLQALRVQNTDMTDSHRTTTNDTPPTTAASTHDTHNRPVTTNHNTSNPTTLRHRRRRRRNKRTKRYWRKDNHNIQLDTNSVINLSTCTLSPDETQLLARGLTFCLHHDK